MACRAIRGNANHSESAQSRHKTNFFLGGKPKIRKSGCFTVETSRIEAVIQRFEILPKPPSSFGTE